MPFVDIGGVSMHYRHRHGDGPVLVFINSLGTDFRIWDDMIAALDPNAGLLVYDKRGHGLSGLGAGVRSIDDHANDLAALLDRLDIDGTVLCGLSIGGLIAQRLLMIRPQPVRAMVLCDTAARIGTTASWDKRIETVTREGIEAIADPIMETWFTPAFHRNRPADLAGYRNMLVRQSVAGYLGSCAALREADYREAAGSISVPTLWVVGDQDGSTPPELVSQTADLVPGARFEVIAGAGHIPCIEKAAALAALISGFVAALPGRKP
ncbi:3-oxoadipate enol-lactonase [Mesorhizobium marinum]|uniref:3-oxoadipate enol-lactonase n=1 Tax=Mesorhizobium marinum TaxID=3228790 RepID=UPI0034654EA6